MQIRNLVCVAALLAGCAEVRDTAANRFQPATPGTLVVGAVIPTEGFWEGTPAQPTGGFEYALAGAIAELLGLELAVAEVPFADVVAGDLGPADVALQEVSVTTDRHDGVDFSVPYLATAATVVARRGGGDAATMRDLATARDVRWAVRTGTSQHRILTEVVRPDHAATEVDTTGEALAAVEEGKVEAALVDLSDALLAAARSAELVAVARFDQIEDVAVVLPEGSTDNVRAVDQAIRTLQANGTIDRLAEQWLESAFATDPESLPVIVTR